MQDKIVAIDFSGTFIKVEVAEEANKFRAKVLGRSLPTKEEHARSKELYKINNEFVEKLTGLKKDAKVNYVTNKKERIFLRGEEIQTQIATNLFQIGMYMVAKEKRLDIFPDGLVEALKYLKSKKYKIAIVSGIRSDIISGMFEISGIKIKPDYILGQNPILSFSNKNLLDELKEKGTVVAVLGDKYSDLEPAKELDAKAIFVKGGHPSGNEEEIADFVLESWKDINKYL
ncbi:MAG: HAD hydrolase-like protein [Candidatus Nanoarchaeia archaeon]|nr:HAD hydrolase-like protein [Candidatus Nanoarchaeia archaeon]